MKNTSIPAGKATVRACDVRINLPSTANPFASSLNCLGTTAQTISRLQELVNAIDPNIHYKEAVRILKAIHFETNGGDDGIEIAAQWCLKGNNFQDRDEIEALWRVFTSNPQATNTLATIVETIDKNCGDWIGICDKYEPQFERCETVVVNAGQQPADVLAMVSATLNTEPDKHTTPEASTGAVENSELTPLSLDAAMTFAKSMVETAATDCGAPFLPASLASLALIYQESPADYYRIRNEIKLVNKCVSVMALDRAVKGEIAEQSFAQTHHGYANDILDHLTVDGCAPVGYEGELWVVNSDSALWEKMPNDHILRLVAERHDGCDYCTRATDYRSIAAHAVSLATDAVFFTDAPVGIASPQGFLKVVGDKLVMEQLTAEHRQRVMLSFTPTDLQTPLFDKLLQETFESPIPGEKEQQIRLLQEIIGATMVGIMPRYQKAVQFYEPYGRAGKGTVMRLVTELVPKNYITAVSPFKWDDEYYLAMLVGSRLNQVGELPDDKPIPAAAFKTVTGGDLLTGRHPAGRPVTFKNDASHIFMTNHMITTKDQSEAFFARWLLLDFPNSRTRFGLTIDPSLADTIIKNEMPGIAYWAMQGAIRLLCNDKFSQSAAHDRLMAKWRKSTNSLEEFIGEVCTLGDGLKEKRSLFYVCYINWCKDSGRKPFAKGKVKDLLEHNVGMGVSLVELNGHETFKGVQVSTLLRDSLQNR